jgi:hypothetical protein
MKIDAAIVDVRDAEAELAGALRKVGERHSTESDVYYVARTLAARCAQQLERIAAHANRYGVNEGRDPDGKLQLERVGRLSAELVSSEEATGVLLVHDLEELYLFAHRAELAWVVLLQAARAARDSELVAASQAGREEAERRWKWVRTAVKQASPQILAAG